MFFVFFIVLPPWFFFFCWKKATSIQNGNTNLCGLASLKKVGKKILLHPWNSDSQFLLSVCSWDKAQTHCCCVLIPGPSRKQAGGAVTSCGSITVVLMMTLALLSTSRLGPVRLAFSGSKSQNFFFCADTQKYREKNWQQLTRSLFIPSFSSWHFQSNEFSGANSQNLMSTLLLEP